MLKVRNRPDNSATRVVADVGGTNTRLAIFDPVSGEFRGLRSYRNNDFSQLQDIIGHWLAQLDEAAPRAACFAVAGPPAEDYIQVSNTNWAFSRRDMASRLGFDHCRWLNDFEGNAYALLHLKATDIQTLQQGIAKPNPLAPVKLATVGPGTGLGGATVTYSADSSYATTAEPGQMGLSPGSLEELELFKLLLQKHDNIYAELLLCGGGLQRLYRALCQLHGVSAEPLSPAEISRLAETTAEPRCQRALEIFCGQLGALCGDFTLANGSYQGLYLAGGILPQIIPFLHDSSFLQRFSNKGSMQAHLQQVPIYVIVSAQPPALVGAAHACIS